ncbi:glycosyltransferase family 2 protein [Acidaminococcus massiliensis]|uniref:glycosyltransferase family 2 protein n=1 Tax=Acidaminococcus massiliensis TaxID=1852375 RepID=UPI003520A060
MVDVLTLNYNDSETIISFLKSIKDFQIVHHILVVDNCSIDDSFLKLKKFENDKITVIQTDHNGGYGAGNNLGMRYLAAHGMPQFVLQCNPDVIINESTIEKLEKFLREHDDYVMVAPFMLNKYGEKESNSAFPLATKWQYILSLDIILNKLLSLNAYKNLIDCTDEYKEVDAVAGSLFMMDLKKMIHGGMYDEHIFLYCEEMSLGIKLRDSGYKTALLPCQTFIHNHSISINKTFQSTLSRRKLLVKSKLYVIKSLYHSNTMEYCIAWILSRLSFLEIMLLELWHR